MSDIRVVFLLLALAPGLARSSVPEPTLPPLVSAPPEPAPLPALIPEQSVEAKPEVERYSLSPGRVAVEGFGGVAGGVVGTLGGLLIGLSAGVGEDCRGGDVCSGRPLGAMGILGFATTAAPSVYVSGRLLGGRGRFIPTVVSGMVAGGISAAAYMGGADRSSEVTVLLMGFPLAASMVAYEVSAAWEAPEPRTLAKSHESEPVWAPQVSFLPGGGSVGITGSF